MFILLRVLFLLLMCCHSAFAQDVPIQVAVFQGSGVGSSSEKLIAILKAAADGKFEITRVTADQIRSGNLDDVDVLIFPGGSGGKQGKSLGKDGRAVVQDFVHEGGAYLGICAGAYLATNDYDWSLNLIDAKVLDRRHWDRGNGTVKIQLSPSGSELFQHDGLDMTIYYAQGPLLARREWDDPEVPDYESLAIYATEIAKNGAPKGVMAGTSAVVRCAFGNGRVFCFGPHPELTDGRRDMIPLAIDWLVAKKSPTETQ